MKKKYKITYYIDGVQHTKIIEAVNRDEAMKIAWSIIDADDLCVSEVK